MSSTLSLRRMWTMYKKLLIEDGMSRRQVLAQGAFYSGARCVLKVLDHLVEDGDVDELQRVIRRHGRTIRVLQGKTPRKPRH
jgi:alkylated DNA nucleotide flippase Atl1